MRLEEFSLPLETPLSTASGEIARREGFAVRIDDGVGEATPLPGWTESLEECREALAGIDDPEAVIGNLEDRPAARHGLSLSLADRDARDEGVSLSRLLGDGRAETVAVNATVGDASPEESANAAREAVENGFETVKCKVGARSVVEDVERVRVIREAVGSGPAIRLDANGGWSREEAARALDELAEYDLEYVEQPLVADDLAGHRELSSPVPIALDESLAGRTVAKIEALADVADTFVLKPMALGGIDRVVELGRRLGDVVVTTTIDAVIARTAAVHAAAALDLERACGLATADMLAEDLAPDPAPVRDGTIPVPTGPGLGTDGPWAGGAFDA
ncbi:D-gluconate/D-galactonate dehydratase [Halalkalicoccus paucihalophilus]|uniref:o-succinylbenzoate synthase n=1 Tax=Halalkalicoccus paucihalophilus TaxID=1008153 RepID=A0A151AGQ5_9EURY|nr:enolase C-terminal domain-like protein [Halalkalicoccus paucihalophilus]KYH26836.1 D-gluconate/D-galactonate dehydratase [Halalkalicoccus paucihalophilus]